MRREIGLQWPFVSFFLSWPPSHPASPFICDLVDIVSSLLLVLLIVNLLSTSAAAAAVHRAVESYIVSQEASLAFLLFHSSRALMQLSEQ